MPVAASAVTTMHQPMDPLPYIFSIGDLEALGDDKWDMDASLFGGCCSPFASGDATDCIMPASDERGGSTSPLGEKPGGFFTLPADFADCSGPVASAAVPHRSSEEPMTTGHSFDIYSTGPSLAGRAQSLDTQLQSFGTFSGAGQSFAARAEPQDTPMLSFGICSEAGQSLAGRAQAAALEEHHLMGGDLRSELLRGAVSPRPLPQYNYSGELGGSSQIGQQIAGWVSSNGSTFLEASQTAAVKAAAAAAGGAGGQYTDAAFHPQALAPAPRRVAASNAAVSAFTAPAPVSASVSVSPDASLATEAAPKLRSDAGSRDVGVSAVKREGSVAPAKVAALGLAAALGAGSADSNSACHSTIQVGAAAPLQLTGAARAKLAVVRPSSSGIAPKRAVPHPGSLSLALAGSGSEADERVAKRCSGSRFDDMIDPSSTPEERRRQRRMLSNRESARRSRRRKENFLQTAEEQLAELAAARAAAAADAEEAAQKLASLHAAFTAVTAERDQLRQDNERLRRKMEEADLGIEA